MVGSVSRDDGFDVALPAGYAVIRWSTIVFDSVYADGRFVALLRPGDFWFLCLWHPSRQLLF